MYDKKVKFLFEYQGQSRPRKLFQWVVDQKSTSCERLNKHIQGYF